MKKPRKPKASDTPETDAYVAKLAHDWVLDFGAFDLLLTHARDFERERDEAREDAANLRRMSVVELMSENLNVKHHVTEWENRCLKAERERNEARDMVNRLRKQRAIARNFGEQMERERDALKSQISNL